MQFARDACVWMGCVVFCGAAVCGHYGGAAFGEQKVAQPFVDTTVAQPFVDTTVAQPFVDTTVAQLLFTKGVAAFVDTTVAQLSCSVVRQTLGVFAAVSTGFSGVVWLSCGPCWFLVLVPGGRSFGVMIFAEFRVGNFRF